jgi:hypothetical protein
MSERPTEDAMDLWDGVTMKAVCDAVQVFMCAVVLGCVLSGRWRRGGAGRLTVPDFAAGVRLESWRQETDRALAAVESAVRSERLRLAGLGGTGASAPVAGGAPDPEPADQAPFRLGDAALASAAPVGPERYDALARLAACGGTARDIAARTRLPAGEVELALKLRRLNA